MSDAEHPKMRVLKADHPLSVPELDAITDVAYHSEMADRARHRLKVIHELAEEYWPGNPFITEADLDEIVHPCHDCDVDTFHMGGEARVEWYMVHDDIWHEAGMTPEGYLCIGCLEKRLGRELRAADFIQAPVNDPERHDDPSFAATYRTERLQARLTSHQ